VTSFHCQCYWFISVSKQSSVDLIQCYSSFLWCTYKIVLFSQCQTFVCMFVHFSFAVFQELVISRLLIIGWWKHVLLLRSAMQSMVLQLVYAIRNCDTSINPWFDKSRQIMVVIMYFLFCCICLPRIHMWGWRLWTVYATYYKLVTLCDVYTPGMDI